MWSTTSSGLCSPRCLRVPGERFHRRAHSPRRRGESRETARCDFRQWRGISPARFVLITWPAIPRQAAGSRKDAKVRPVVVVVCREPVGRARSCIMHYTGITGIIRITRITSIIRTYVRPRENRLARRLLLSPIPSTRLSPSLSLSVFSFLVRFSSLSRFSPPPFLVRLHWLHRLPRLHRHLPVHPRADLVLSSFPAVLLHRGLILPSSPILSSIIFLP